MIKSLILGLTLPILLFSQDLNDLIMMSLENKMINASTKKYWSGTRKSMRVTKKGYLPKP